MKPPGLKIAKTAPEYKQIPTAAITQKDLTGYDVSVGLLWACASG